MKKSLVACFLFFVIQYSVLGAEWRIVIDDFQQNEDSQSWFYSRIGTDRGKMGDGNYSLELDHGTANVEVTTGWAGVWTSMKHTANELDDPEDTIHPERILGPYISDDWQMRLTAVEVDLVDGHGALKVEFKDVSGDMLFNQTKQMIGPGTLTFQIDASSMPGRIKMFNWLVDGTGDAIVEEIRLIVECSADLNWQQAAFLFSYNHLCQAYDPATGFLRDRARWPVEDFAAVQCMGTFALSSVIAANLGFVDQTVAINIVEKVRNAILNDLPRCHGLLPHFVEDMDGDGVWEIVQDPNDPEKTEWSSIDTVITLLSSILSCQALGLETDQLENMISNIDWNLLTENGTKSISHGFSYSCPDQPLSSRWDVFGSEFFIIASTYASATENIPICQYCNSPTWDGSGFNDEMAALFFPMVGTDIWNNNWYQYRKSAFNEQYEFFFNYPGGPYLPYTTRQLFGLSACEVPEPWAFPDDFDIYGAWGVGGHVPSNDGSSVVGYPILAPHYVAMISSEHYSESQMYWDYMLQNNFTPLNNVESLGIDQTDNVHWNSLKGSWNLSLQTLGMGRALSACKFITYEALSNNSYLLDGYNSLMPDGFDPLSVTLDISRDCFEVFDDFLLQAIIKNPGPESYTDIPFVVLLDIYGEFFWYPEWGTSFSFEPIDLGVGACTKEILHFTWPDIEGAANDILFYGAILNHELTEILGNWDMVKFGWGNCDPTPTPTLVPTNTWSPQPTDTPSPPFTPTPNYTFTPTRTPTRSPTPTLVPTNTWSPQPTDTPSPSFTPTPITPSPTPTQPPLQKECENFDRKGEGLVMNRTNASQGLTWRIPGPVTSNSWIEHDFTFSEAGNYNCWLRYSNDNSPDPTETVMIYLDDQLKDSFVSDDTGDFGLGWNIFHESPLLSLGEVLPGVHTIKLFLVLGDDNGFEFDVFHIENN